MHFINDPINNFENLKRKSEINHFSIYLVVIIIIVFCLISLPFVKVDVTSQSRGIVISNIESVPINTIVSGKVISVNLKNNQYVKKGDTLLTILDKSIRVEKQLNDSLHSTTRLLINDFQTLIKSSNYKKIKTKEIQEVLNAHLVRLRELENDVEQSELVYRRQKQLFENEVISKSNIERYEFELRSAKTALDFYKTKEKSKWENQIAIYKQRLLKLERSIRVLDLESNNFVVTAPISGTIENALGLQIGSFIDQSRSLANISPDSELIIESIVDPKNIGLIKSGQPVRFLFDAFNFNQWGAIDGKVIDVDKNITIENNNFFFKVRCNINSKEFKLSNGYTTPISKGMTLNSQFFIARRSLFQLLSDTIEDWFNPNIIKNN